MRYGEEDRILFHKMLNECSEKEYAKCMITKGENFSTESLFLTLIFQQHKMINELVAKLRDNKKDNRWHGAQLRWRIGSSNKLVCALTKLRSNNI